MVELEFMGNFWYIVEWNLWVMKVEYDIIVMIMFFCFLEKWLYIFFGLLLIVLIFVIFFLLFCGVFIKNFVYLLFFFLFGGFLWRFLFNVIFFIFEYDIEGLELGLRVLDELFCFFILLCVKVIDGVDSFMGVELELLVVFMLFIVIW